MRIELLNRPDLQAQTGTQNFGNSMIGPVVDVVERPLEQEPLGRVAVIVQDHDNRVQTVPGDGGEFQPGHLERTVTDDDQDPGRWVRHAGTDRGGHAKAHGRVIGGAEELGLAMHLQVGGAEE